MNVVHLLGRLVAAPEMRQTPDGKNTVARFRIAVPKNKDKTNFFNVTAWNRTAEYVCEYFGKGDRIIVHGSIDNGDYPDKDGKRQYTVDILADRCEFADTKASKENSQVQPQENLQTQPPLPPQAQAPSPPPQNPIQAQQPQYQPPYQDPYTNSNIKEEDIF